MLSPTKNIIFPEDPESIKKRIDNLRKELLELEKKSAAPIYKNALKYVYYANRLDDKFSKIFPGIVSLHKRDARIAAYWPNGEGDSGPFNPKVIVNFREHKPRHGSRKESPIFHDCDINDPCHLDKQTKEQINNSHLMDRKESQKLGIRVQNGFPYHEAYEVINGWDKDKGFLPYRRIIGQYWIHTKYNKPGTLEIIEKNMPC